MNQGDLFQQDWHNCLRAHFEYVIREQDTLNESSLITVLSEVGYSEDDLLALRDEIVMRLGLPEPNEVPLDADAVSDDVSQFEAELIQPPMAAPSPDPLDSEATAQAPDLPIEASAEAAASDEVDEDSPQEPPESSDLPEPPITQMSLF